MKDENADALTALCPPIANCQSSISSWPGEELNAAGYRAVGFGPFVCGGIPCGACLSRPCDAHNRTARGRKIRGWRLQYLQTGGETFRRISGGVFLCPFKGEVWPDDCWTGNAQRVGNILVREAPGEVRRVCRGCRSQAACNRIEHIRSAGLLVGIFYGFQPNRQESENCDQRKGDDPEREGHLHEGEGEGEKRLKAEGRSPKLCALLYARSIGMM